MNSSALLAIDSVGGAGVLTMSGAGTFTLADAPFTGGPVTNNGALVIDNGSGGIFVVVRELTIGPTAVQRVLDGILEIGIDGLRNDVLSVEGSGGLQFGDSARIRFVLAGAPALDFDQGFLCSSLLTGFDGDVAIWFLGLGPGMCSVVFERDADLHVRLQAQAVPLPSSLLLVLMGLMAMQGTRRVKARRHARGRPAGPKRALRSTDAARWRFR